MKKLFDAFGAQVNNIIHENPNTKTLSSNDIRKLELKVALMICKF